MKKVSRCIICLGSNEKCEYHLNMAEKILNRTFPGICWGGVVKTAPEGTDIPEAYLNRAAIINTGMTPEELKVLFKKIEEQCGRTPESKQTGIIPLDIDLLVYDHEIIKPSDMKKNYVLQALSTLPDKE